MTISITPQQIITLSSCIAAIIALTGYIFKARDWVRAQDRQSDKINALREQHNRDIAAIREEQTLLVYGVLSCLRGLREIGCNGPVSEAIDKIERRLNIEAHRGGSHD